MKRILREAEYRYPTPSEEEIKAKFRPKVRMVYNDPATGARAFKVLPWRHECTTEALAAWLESYFDRTRSGYLPQGFTKAPIPIIARIYRIPSEILAEWRLSPAVKDSPL